MSIEPPAERILLLTENFPPLKGGSSRWFYEVYRRLRGARVRVLTAQCEEGVGTTAADPNLSVARVRWGFDDWGLVAPNSLLRYVAMVRATVSAARSFGATTIHCGRNLPEGFIGRVAGRLLRVPVICFVHGEELNTARSSRQLKWLTRWVFSGCARVIANSDNTRHLLEEDWSMSPDRVYRLYPGVDTSLYTSVESRDAIKARLGWMGRVVILTVGRLQRRKGQDVVIKTLTSLRERAPEILYSIVGDGEELVALEQLVRDLDVGDMVEFRGEIEDPELIDCYLACDLFVLANREVDGDFEGFGMVLVEAQAAGKAVVAGASGGTAETMQPGVTGALVDATSVDQLGATLTQLIDDEGKRTQMGNLGAIRARELFDWEALAAAANGALVSSGPCVDQAGRGSNAGC